MSAISIHLKRLAMKGGDLLSLKFVRSFSLLVFLLGYLSLCSVLVPIEGNYPDLVDEVKKGDVSQVWIFGGDTTTATIYWSSGYLGDHEFTLVNHDLQPSGALFRGHLARDVNGDLPRIMSGERLESMSMIDFFVPLQYVKAIPYLSLPVAVLCLIVFLDIMCRSRRRCLKRTPWVVSALVFGVGFVAYVWSEPSPLLSHRAGRSSMTGREIAFVTLGWWLLAAVGLTIFAVIR